MQSKTKTAPRHRRSRPGRQPSPSRATASPQGKGHAIVADLPLMTVCARTKRSRRPLKVRLNRSATGSNRAAADQTDHRARGSGETEGDVGVRARSDQCSSSTLSTMARAATLRKARGAKPPLRMRRRRQWPPGPRPPSERPDTREPATWRQLPAFQNEGRQGVAAGELGIRMTRRPSPCATVRGYRCCRARVAKGPARTAHASLAGDRNEEVENQRAFRDHSFLRRTRRCTVRCRRAFADEPVLDLEVKDSRGCDHGSPTQSLDAELRALENVESRRDLQILEDLRRGEG